uniref:Mlo4 n=1 Tax=Arundo donax TaxID=35708 RepID=A0A0A9DZS7_ARUDO
MCAVWLSSNEITPSSISSSRIFSSAASMAFRFVFRSHFAKRERERSTRKHAATMSVVTVATDHVGVSASDLPASTIPAHSHPPGPASPPSQFSLSSL